jgi:hypothetical protein
MKTTKMNLFVIAILLFSLKLMSQQSRYIEISVSDTIYLKATEYTYQINLGEQIEFMGMTIPMNHNEEDEDFELPSMEQITKKLDQEKYNYTLIEINTNITSKPQFPYVLVTLKSLDELNKLVMDLKEFEGISGNLKDSKFESIESFYDEINSSLYLKATKRANSMAKMMNLNVGKIVNISEVMTQPNEMMDFYTEIMQKMSMKLIDSQNFGEKMEVVQLLFKFELL